MGQSQRVLVVGGAGYIGSHICKALHARGEEPVVFDNLSSGHRHAVQWGELIEGDIRDSAALDAALARYRPGAVMHFAGCIEVGEGESDPLRFWDNNVTGVISLLGAMQRADGCGNLVFSSTCATYGEPEVLPITEAEPQTPVSVYGRTKLVAEQLLENAARASDLTFATLRYFNAAGASPNGEIGEEHDPETHLIPNALKAAAGLGGRLKLFGMDYDTPDGTCIRDYIHVSDLADAHVAALDRLRAGAPSFACNLGTGHGMSVLEILEAVEAVVGRPVPYDVMPRRDGDAARLLADITQAREWLGFAPKYSRTRQIIGDAWNFHRARWQIPTYES